MWRGDGKELFYMASDRRMMSVTVTTGDSFEATIPKRLFVSPVDANPNVRSRYVVSNDGERFLFVSPLVSGAHAPINVIVNWDAEIRNQ